MTAMQFQGFKPQAMERIAGTLGYQGDMGKFKDFLQSDPDAQMKFNDFQNKAIQMMNGGMVRKNYANGGMGFTYGQYNGKKLDDLSGAERRAYESSLNSYQAQQRKVGTPVLPSTSNLQINPASGGTEEKFINRMPMYEMPGFEGSSNPVKSYTNPKDYGFKFPEPDPDNPFGNKYPGVMYDYIGPNGERVSATAGMIPPPGFRRVAQPTLDENGNVIQPERLLEEDDPRDTLDTPESIGQTTVNRMQDPRLPVGGVATATGTVAQSSQDIAAGAGQVAAASPTATATQGTAAQATAFAPSTLTLFNDKGEQFSIPEPDYNYTYEQALIRMQQRDVKSPKEQAAIEAALQGNTIAETKTKTNLDMANVSTVAPVTTAGTIEQTLDKTQTAQGTVPDKALVTAQQETESAVSAIDAAQGTAIKMNNPVQRELQAGEIIEPAANAAKASQFTEQIQAAEATASNRATVKGQLDTLMADFEGGDTPAWAAGALRNATAQMAARGLGASSMAGQALVQAAMESALPIASTDAQTIAGFEMKNLSNRQERAMLAAQQRATFMGMEFDQAFQSRVANSAKISDIANMNFTAEQQVALENSRAANTMNLSNLSNRQALTMAEASSLANLDMANLNNRQAAAVMNAQSFLASEMTNLSNEQQVEVFKAQTRTQSMFTDQAAVNAAKQFNATSENQSDQFFANLKTQTSQFNTTQANAMSQFNAGEENAINKFNTEIQNQRDQFNAQNALVIAQSNAVWRREIATAATAAVNRANEINAASVLDMSNQAYSNLWQEHADMMEWAWTSSDNERDRQNAVTLSHLAAGRERSQAEYQSDVASSSAIGDFVSKLALGYAGKIFGF